MKISDIADIINVSVKDPSNSGVDVFVGLEHYDIAEPVIKRYGGTKMLSTAAKKFEAGDVLIARRNVYLQRAAVARFSGLTSGDSIILRVKENLCTKDTDYETMCRLLPFVLNSINFWDYANTNADGTMSKRLSPAMLLEYEFNLPSIDAQKVLADKLWAAYEVKQSYLRMIEATEKMVKSQFVEMFSHIFAEGDIKTLSELVSDDRPITYGVIKPGTFVESGIYLVKVKDMCDGKVNINDLAKISPEVDVMYSRSKLKEGDVLLSIRGTIGRVVIVSKELEGANITQDTARISLKPDINNYYVKCILESPIIQDWISMHICGLAVKGINLADVRRIPIPMADSSLQKEYIDMYHQADKSKFELKKTIEAIDKVIKSLINENL